MHRRAASPPAREEPISRRRSSSSSTTTTTATIRDVATAAGVSLGTASRVINGHASVTPEVRHRVEAAIAALGYVPNPLAQGMRRGATRTAGVMVRDITVPALAGFVRAAQDLLQHSGFTLLITCSEDRREQELELLRRLAGRRIDGLIMTTCSEEDPGLLAARESFPVPVVLLDRETPAAFDSTLVAHREGARRAIEHLLALGHRRIALITGPPTVRPGRERVAAYEEAFAARGLVPDRSLIRAEGFDGEAAFREASALLGAAAPPSAILCGGNAVLAAALRAIQARGLRIPQDISVIGSNDSELAMLATVPITVVRWDYAALGRNCAHMLLQRMQGEATGPGRRIILPAEFVLRASCAAPPPEAERALTPVATASYRHRK